jgi:hypothetical protein
MKLKSEKGDAVGGAPSLKRIFEIEFHGTVTIELDQSVINTRSMMIGALVFTTCTRPKKSPRTLDSILSSTAFT